MVKIYIEGKNKKVPESEFLRAILDHIGVPATSYELVYTNGYTSLMDASNGVNVAVMRANTDADGKNLVIFDADTASNNGGFSIRQNELLMKGKALGLDFDLFLWPDNSDDGDVEVLMESIARKDLYPEFFDCFGKYEHCISQRKNEKGDPFYTSPNRKGKLHTYFNSLPISNTKKSKFGNGAWCWRDPEIWNLDAESLKPIKEFLSNYLL